MSYLLHKSTNTIYATGNNNNNKYHKQSVNFFNKFCEWKDCQIKNTGIL